MSKTYYSVKVLHFSYALTWGGGEQQMVNLIEGVAHLQVNNIVVCVKGSMLEKYFESRDIDCISIEREKGFNFSFLKRLRNLINDNHPDIIHIHTGSFLQDFLMLSKLFSIRYKTVFTMNGMIRKKSFLSKIKYNNSKIDRYYCISKSVEENFRKNVLYSKNHSKTSVVYDGISLEKEQLENGIDVREQFSLTQNVKIVGNIANHTDAKDLMTFFKTANYIVNEKEVNDIVFLQLGRKSKKTSEFLDYIKDHNLEKNVHVLGFVENGKAYLDFFDCFLMTSYREGLSMSILESFLYKVPVVSTRAGGVPEAVIHEKTGLLADIGDYETLGDEVIRLFSEDGLATLLQTKAYQKLLDNFTKEILAQNTLNVYKEVVHEED